MGSKCSNTLWAHRPAPWVIPGIGFFVHVGWTVGNANGHFTVGGPDDSSDGRTHIRPNQSQLTVWNMNSAHPFDHSLIVQSSSNWCVLLIADWFSPSKLVASYQKHARVALWRLLLKGLHLLHVGGLAVGSPGVKLLVNGMLYQKQRCMIWFSTFTKNSYSNWGCQ